MLCVCVCVEAAPCTPAAPFACMLAQCIHGYVLEPFSIT
jgi:hypothetical protein